MHRLTTIRRAALARILMLALAASIGTAGASRLDAQSARPTDAWLRRAGAKHRQLFDAPAPVAGIPLVHILNYYDTWNKAYGVHDGEIAAIGTFYGTTTFFGLNDAMWAKYRIGEFLGEKDASGAPAVRNPWRQAPVILGLELRGASIEALQKRGATFILCNNALGIFADMLAKARGLNGAEVYADLRSNILPGVELIPAMVVAIEQAHAAGFSYHRQ